jgi:hypothetical protein
MKTLLYVVAGLVVVAVAGFLIFAFSLGSIVKGGVNKFGPQITQAKVELAGATISPFSGEGTLSDLFVGNPAGWQSDHAFALHQISISAEPRSLLGGDHIVINSIVIDQPDIIYETKITSSNLQDLQKNIEQSASASSSGNTTTQPTTSSGQPVKIEIKSFRLQNAKITVQGLGNSATVTMPTIALENLGTKEGGLTPPQLAAAIMKEITAQALQAAGRAATERGLMDKAGQGLQKLLGGKK